METKSSEKTVDGVVPEIGERWTFDGDVTAAFDDMLARSIPQYDLMRDLCFRVANRYVKHQMGIIDLGCSRGEAMGRLVDKHGAANMFLGLEVSKPMLDAARERFKGMIRAQVVEIREFDLRTGFPFFHACVIQSILTIQFIPIEHRQRILRDVYKNLVPGGAFIFVEKVLGETADIDQVLVAEYYDEKRKNGYTEEQIQRKKLSLEGVLVPVTAKWNEELLRMAGFRQIDCFWRSLNFAGWLAVKD